MRVRKPRGHAELVEGLWQSARGRGLPHAISLEGVGGSGRFLAAQWLAAGLLCEAGPGEPCGACAGCKKVASGGWRSNHADLFVVDEVQYGEELIRLGRIAYRPDESKPVEHSSDCFERFFPLRPLEGRWRVALVREAHRMSLAAQNALLKTLEEPPPDTLLVLETHRPDLLLETIRSRCVRVQTQPLSRADTRAILREEELSGADELARWSGGSPGEALRLAATGAVAMRGLVAASVAGEVSAQEAAAGLWEVEGDFPGSTEARRSRARVRSFLDLALACLRDGLGARAGRGADELAHGDLAELFQAVSGRRLARSIERLLLARGDVDANLAPDAAVERAFLALEDLVVRAAV